MGYKKYELKVTFVIDDTKEDIVDDIKQMELGILAGELQRELLQHEGYSQVNIILKQIK